MLKLVKAKINRPKKKKHEWLKQGGHARLPFEKFITKLKGKIKVVVFLIRQKKKKKLLKRGGHALGRTYYYNILQASSNVLHACEKIFLILF